MVSIRAVGCAESCTRPPSVRPLRAGDNLCLKSFPPPFPLDSSFLAAGVFLCINCAGVHRSLGVQNSVVKSLALDAWTHKEAMFMAFGGNSKSKAFFEERGLSNAPISKRYTSEAAKVSRYIDRIRRKQRMDLHACVHV